METQAHTTDTSRMSRTSHTSGPAPGGGKGTKIAYAVTERNGRSFWNRIGVAFINKDGSINVKLEAIPVTGQLQLRDWEPRDDAPTAPGAQGTSARSTASADHILTELPF